MKCYLCDNEKINLISEKLRYNSDKKVYRCDQCGLVFLYPQMTSEEERIFYENEYGEIFSSEKGVTPADLFKSRQPDANLYYEMAKDYISKDSECLEIGCASGYFIDRIKNEVKSVAGIETHNILSQHCKNMGIKMYDSLANCPYHAFDVVFLFFVLEHIGDPVAFLLEIKKHLKKNGKLFIMVPNVNDALLTLYDIPAFRAYYFTPAHQFYYGKETMKLLLEKAGYGKMEFKMIQRYDLSNHMQWLLLGKPGGTGKYNNVFSEGLNDKYKNDLVNSGKGDTLIAIGTGGSNGTD